jgi:hypothetical protein
MRLASIVPTLLVAAFATSAAQAVEFNGVEVSGFASLGYVNSSDNNYLADGSEDGSWELNNVALNFGYQASDRLRFAAQIYASNLGNSTEDARYESDFAAPNYSWKNGGVAVDLAFAQYTVADQFGVRIGRVKQPFGLYNEVRDIDAVRGSATLPQAVYDNRSREYDFAVNGGSVFGTIDASNGGSFDYSLFGGKVDIPLNGTVANQYVTPELKLEEIEVSGIYGGQVMWSTPIEGLKIGFSMREMKDRKAKVRFNPDVYVGGNAFAGYSLPDEEMTATQSSETYLGSLELVSGDFTFQAEYQRVSLEQKYSKSQLDLVVHDPFNLGVPPRSSSISTDKQNSEGWYIMGSYRASEQFEIGGFGSFYTAEISDRSTKNWNDYQNDFAAFVRFDSDVEGLLFKVEGHVVRGTGLLNVPDKQAGYFNGSPTTEENWHYIVLKTAYSF